MDRRFAAFESLRAMVWAVKWRGLWKPCRKGGGAGGYTDQNSGPSQEESGLPELEAALRLAGSAALWRCQEERHPQ